MENENQGHRPDQIMNDSKILGICLLAVMTMVISLALLSCLIK